MNSPRPRPSGISSAGELVCRRPLAKAADGFVPGQHEARIIDPHPHRDRADLAAVLTYVDDEGRACSVTCMRYRDDRGWRSLTLHRASLKKIERTTAVGAPDLTGILLATVETAAAAAEPFPFQPPSEDEQQMRRLAHHLIDQVERGEAKTTRAREEHHDV